MHLNEFYARCVRHDWFYQYSGDKRELEIGDCEESLLASAAYSSQRLDRVYSAFCAWRHGRLHDQEHTSIQFPTLQQALQFADVSRETTTTEGN